MFKKNKISIDIGAYTIKIIVGNVQNRQLLIKEVYICPTPPKSYHDGFIRNSNELCKSIKDVLFKNNIKAKNVAFVLQSSSSIIHEIILPYTKYPKELNAMLSFEMEQYFPIEPEEYISEYKILEEFTDNNIKKFKILLAAIPKKIVNHYLNLIELLNLRPAALNLHSDTISRLFEEEQYINNNIYQIHKTISLISLGYEQIHVVLIEKGLLKLQWLIPQGIGNISSYFHKLSETKYIKPVETSKNNAHINAPLTAELIQVKIDKLIHEIQIVLQYYLSKSEEHHIDNIYIYGGGSNILGIAEYMQSKLNIPTSKIESLGNIKFTRRTQMIDLSIYLNAISALF